MNLYQAVEREWMKDAFDTENGLVSLIELLYPKPEVYNVVISIAKAIKKLYKDNYDPVAEKMIGDYGVIVSFDDDPGISKEDVLNVIKEANVD